VIQQQRSLSLITPQQ